MNYLSSSIPLSDESNDAEYNSEPDDYTIELEDRPMPSVEATLQVEIQEEEDGSDEEDQGTDEPIVLTSGTSNPLLTSNVTHVPLLPEYPDSSAVGFTYCVNMDKESAQQKEALVEAMQFQYCRKQKGPAKKTTSPYLGGPAIRHRYQCTGIKCCEYLHNTLRTYSHSRVTPDTWQELKNARQGIERTDNNRQSQNSTSLYLAVTHRFASGTSCPHQNPQCTPLLRQMRRETVSGVRAWYIGCASWSWQSAQREKHFFRPISSKYSLPRLQELFRDGLQEAEQQPEFCGTVESTLVRMRNCNVDHPQGPGKLIHQGCNVTFDVIIPCNLVETPYYLFSSRGVHTHPPPPPHKTPEQLKEEIVGLIKRINDPSLTTAKFLCSPFLEELCKKHCASHFTNLHPTLNNLSWIERQVYRTNLVVFPKGQDLAGAEYEWRRQKQNPSTAYIQHIHTDALGTFIICFSKEQAELFVTQKSFQVDLSFKRINKQNFKEILFAMFHEEHGKVITLARILVNSERRRMYTACFTTFFRILSEVAQKRLKWKHIHGQGIVGITVDMDGKQFAGLGRYLSSIDPMQRDWQWQMRNIVIFCQIHFARSISTSVPGVEDEYSVHHRMRELLSCQSLQDYMELCNLLIIHEQPTVRNWARHKKNAVIAAGLNKHCSLMANEDWDQLLKTSNAVEQSGNKGYSYGKRLRLVRAIHTAHLLDIRDLSQYEAREDQGIRHTARSTSMSSRYMNHLAKDKRHQDGLPRAHEVDLSDDEENDAILFQASSSGHVRASSVLRRGRTPSRGNRRSVSRLRSSSSAQDLQTAWSTPSNDNVKRQALNNNTDLQHRRLNLELREKEAEVKRRELENTRLEIELEERKRALGLSTR